jgi:origin recognition complex subunit 3
MYAPPIVVGPPVLEFLGDYFSRWNGILDGLTTVLQACSSSFLSSSPFKEASCSQLVHMQHFTEPLTALTLPSPKLTSQPYSSEDFPVIDALFTRIGASKIVGFVPPDHVERWNDTTVDSLLEDLERARTKFWHKARRLRIGWQVGRAVARILDGSSRGGAKKEKKDAETEGLVEMMSTYMRGRGGRGFLGKIG